MKRLDNPFYSAFVRYGFGALFLALAAHIFGWL